MATERKAPDAILAMTELSGVVGNIQDDPDSPDGSWLIASGNNVNTDVRVSVPTPTGGPTVGADLQEFRVLFRQKDEGQVGTPDGRIELWENGGLIRAGPDTPISDGGLVVSFLWNANELGTSDGSLVEIKAVGTKSGGSPSNRNSTEVGAIEWNIAYDVGGIVFLDGASGVTSSIAGDIKRTRKIDASVSALSSLSADLKATRKIDGTIDAISSVLADLILAYSLKGTLVSQLALSGELTIVGEANMAHQGMRGDGYFIFL